MRFSPLIDNLFLISLLSGYLFVFIVYTTLVCCFQSDFKRLVAYSSVSHIIVIPFLFLSNNLLSSKALIIIMLFHGLSSPALFLFVGALYSIYSTRQLLLMRGLALISPLLSLLLLITFFFTLSAPPFPSFVAEVFFFISASSISLIFLISFFAFILFSLVYNLNWFTSIIFGPSPLSFSPQLTYLFFFASFFLSAIAFPLSFIMCF